MHMLLWLLHLQVLQHVPATLLLSLVSRALASGII
jgi:hypothetical protein